MNAARLIESPLKWKIVNRITYVRKLCHFRLNFWSAMYVEKSLCSHITAIFTFYCTLQMPKAVNSIKIYIHLD